MKSKHKDLRREIEFRALPQSDIDTSMIIEGKAIVYDEKTKLFSYGGNDYFEIIERGSLEGADLKDVFLKYNHTDNIMVMARSKNNTLEISEREDGVYIRATLAQTSAGKDLFELVRRGDIDKMSFAFSTAEEEYDEKERIWKVRKIKKLYDVAAVPVPAYDSTDIYARRKDELENRLLEVESLNLRKKRVSMLNSLYKK